MFDSKAGVDTINFTWFGTLLIFIWDGLKGYMLENAELGAEIRLPDEVVHDVLPRAEVVGNNDYPKKLKEARIGPTYLFCSVAINTCYNATHNNVRSRQYRRHYYCIIIHIYIIIVFIYMIITILFSHASTAEEESAESIYSK